MLPPVIKTYIRTTDKEFNNEALNISGVRTIKLAHRPQGVKVWISTDNTGDNRTPLENRGDGWINLPEPLQNCYVTTEGIDDSDYIEFIWTGSSTDYISFGNALTDVVGSVNNVDNIETISGFSPTAINQIRGFGTPLFDGIIKISLSGLNFKGINEQQSTYYISFFNMLDFAKALNLDTTQKIRLKIDGFLSILDNSFKSNFVKWDNLYCIKSDICLNTISNPADTFTRVTPNVNNGDMGLLTSKMIYDKVLDKKVDTDDFDNVYQVSSDTLNSISSAPFMSLAKNQAFFLYSAFNDDAMNYFQSSISKISYDDIIPLEMFAGGQTSDAEEETSDETSTNILQNLGMIINNEVNNNVSQTVTLGFSIDLRIRAYAA